MQDEPLSIAYLLNLASTISDPDERQDALMELWERQPESEGVAMTVIKRARYRHAWNKRQERKRYSSAVVDDVDMDAAEPIYRGRLYEAASKLEPDLRNVLLLRIVVGMPVAEIAKLLLISPRTVKNRCDRAKQIIRDSFPI